MLELAGRTDEALAVVKEGLAAIPRRHARSYVWLALTLAQMASRPATGSSRASRCGRRRRPPTRVAVHVPPAARGRARARRRRRGRRPKGICERSHRSRRSPPSRSGSACSGRSPASWRCGAGDLDGARAAVQNALDRLELCTDDVMRIARVTAVGLQRRGRAGAARAATCSDAAAGRDARARSRIHLQRLKAAAQDGGPVERAHFLAGHGA